MARKIPLTVAVTTLVFAICLVAPASAQWLNYKTPGIPRTADGKPNLHAPVVANPQGMAGPAGAHERIGTRQLQFPTAGNPQRVGHAI